MDKSLQSAINSYYEIYSDNAEVLSESEVELGQSPTPGGMTPKKPATGSAGPVKKPGNAVPTRKPGQPITSLKDSYEIVLDYLIDEKYADSVDSAEAIMLGMSEQWILSIFEESLNEANRGEREMLSDVPEKHKVTIKRAMRNVSSRSPQRSTRQDRISNRLDRIRNNNSDAGDSPSGSKRGAESPTDK